MVDKLVKKVDFLSAVFTCLFLFPLMLTAQGDSEDYIVTRRLSRDNGFPDPDINGIYFDSIGYAWISTFGGGLVRYDGDSFIRFTEKDDPDFLSDFVDGCSEDGYGRLWVPTAGGINLLDLQTLSLADSFPGMTSGWRRSHPCGPIVRDAKGCMWFCSDTWLYRVAFADDGNLFQVDSLRCDVPNPNLMSLVCDVDNDGAVWTAVRGRLLKVRHLGDAGLRTSGILPGVDIGEDNKATAFLRSGNDVWIGTQKGLYRVDIATLQHRLYRHVNGDPRSLPNDEVTGLCLSPQGDIVVGTLGGVCFFDFADQSFDIYGSRPNSYGNALLPGEMVRCLASRGGQIWVGLEAEGLAIIRRKPLRIVNPSQIRTTTSSIPPTPVRAMYIDSRDVLWLATTGYGLCARTKGLLFRNYDTDNSSLSDNSITTICEDGAGRIWTGSVDGHLNYIVPSSPGVVHIPADNTSQTARSIDVIIAMVYDHVNDYIWISARRGLYYYDLGKERFGRYGEGDLSCLAMCLVGDELWVSSMEGMDIIDLRTLGHRTIADFPYCMALVHDGNTLWAGTYGKGLYKVEDPQGENPLITVYSEKDNLADNQVNGLLVDGIYLWITTEYGLSRLDTQLGEILSFGPGDGLRSMAFCENSIAKGSDGTIYLGGKEGLGILRSNYVRKELGVQPQVVISGYYDGGKFHSLTHVDTIRKDEKDMDFTLKYSDLSFGPDPDIHYEIRVQPLDRKWSQVFQDDTHLKLAHIPGGKYKIQIRAVDGEGNVLSQDGKSLYVRPVPYKRWWFRLACLALLALLGYMIVVWYTRHVNRSRELLKEEVDRQTKMLSDQKKELERKAGELAEQNALLRKQNETIASHNTLLSAMTSKGDTDFSAKLLEAIREKYKDPDLDVHILAEALGMGRSMLNEKIQAAFGQSTAQFIRTYRLNVAKEMICNGTNKGMNISEIAYEVGFNDPKYFTRCFTKEFGTSPSDLSRKREEGE